MFGIGFADGRKAVVGARPFFQDEPYGPVLIARGGGGGGEEFRMGFWLWPLLPPGPMTLAVAWEAQGVPEHTITVDATELVTASERAEKLWDVAPGSVVGGGSVSSGMTAAVRSEPHGKDEGKPNERQR